MEGFHGFVAAIDNLYANKLKVSHDPVCSKINVWTITNLFSSGGFDKIRSLLLCGQEGYVGHLYNRGVTLCQDG